MKNGSINVEFKDPINSLKENLQRGGAKNVEVKRTYNGEVEIKYTIKCADPEGSIVRFLERAGAKNVRSYSNYGGARFDYRLDDIINEREFKHRVAEALKKSGFRAN